LLVLWRNRLLEQGGAGVVMRGLEHGEEINNRYVVERKIGRGGMSQVYEVRDIRVPERRFALKVVAPSRTLNPRVESRFWQEATILRQLHHPNVVQYEEFALPKDQSPYLVMELLSAGSIATLLELAQSRALPPVTLPSGLPRRLALDIACQCLSGLAHAHEQGIAHRDIKPQNLLLVQPPAEVLKTGRCQVKLADFGIAATTSPHLRLTAPGAFVGTPMYSAPERLEPMVSVNVHGADTPDERLLTAEKQADLFSLGMVMYEMWFGLESFSLRPDLDRTDVRGQLLAWLRRFQEQLARHQNLDPDIELIRDLLNEAPDQRPSAHDALRRLQSENGALTVGEAVSMDSRTWSLGDEGAVPATVAPATRSQEPASETASTVEDGEPREPRSSSSLPAPGRTRKLVWAVVGLLGAAGVGVGGLLFFSGGDFPFRPGITEGEQVSAQASGLSPSSPEETRTEAETASDLVHEPPTKKQEDLDAPPGAPGKTVPCQAGQPGILENEFLEQVGKLKIPLRLTADDLSCQVSVRGGVYVHERVVRGSRVAAPGAGTVRLYRLSPFPDGKGRGPCLAVVHTDHFMSKLCGLDDRKYLVKTGQRVRSGQPLGRLTTGLLRWEVLWIPGEGEGSKEPRSLDIRPLIRR